jgi:predicted  nucleic acid-binding Zn-ribbon protein
VSDSPDDTKLHIDLSPELHDWLRDHADGLGVDPETIMFESLAAYRIAAEHDSKLNGDEIALEMDDEAVGDLIAPTIHRFLTNTFEGDNQGDGENEVRESFDTYIDAAVREQLDEAGFDEDRLADLDTDFDTRFEEIQSDFREQIEDVRERVIQVKREADAKAPATHTHDELERLDDLESRLSGLDQDFQSLDTSLNEVTAQMSEYADEEDLDALEEEVEDLRERLTTVAWIVRDIREFAEKVEGPETLQEIKRRAAAANVSKPKCQQCNRRVNIGLLTEAACPHCEASFSELESSGGFFSAPQLRVDTESTIEESTTPP